MSLSIPWKCPCGHIFDDTRSWSSHSCLKFADKLRQQPGLMDEIIDIIMGKTMAWYPLYRIGEKAYLRDLIVAWAARVEAVAVSDSQNDGQTAA